VIGKERREEKEPEKLQRWQTRREEDLRTKILHCWSKISGNMPLPTKLRRACDNGCLKLQSADGLLLYQTVVLKCDWEVHVNWHNKSSLELIVQSLPQSFSRRKETHVSPNIAGISRSSLSLVIF
jgi:hypothetical protein